MKLSDHFVLTTNSEKTHTWVLASHNSTILPEDSLAKALAIKIMEHRLIGCPHHFKAWEKRLSGGEPLLSKQKEAITAFIKPAFGIPENPDSIQIDHLEGLVSQYLWYFLCLETSNEPIIKNNPPGFKATDPGGDALFIHRIEDGNLRFRLWEIKKFVQRKENSSTTASQTIAEAYTQLKENALEYLARYTATGQEEPDAELQNFFGKLVEFWLDKAPEASAGISLNTSQQQIPPKSFSNFGKHFPEFVNPVRLKGMVAAVDDFAAFSMKVREYVWKGL